MLLVYKTILNSAFDRQCTHGRTVLFEPPLCLLLILFFMGQTIDCRGAFAGAIVIFMLCFTSSDSQRLSSSKWFVWKKEGSASLAKRNLDRCLLGAWIWMPLSTQRTEKFNQRRCLDDFLVGGISIDVHVMSAQAWSTNQQWFWLISWR